MFLSSYGKNELWSPSKMKPIIIVAGHGWSMSRTALYIPRGFAGFLPTTYDTNPNKTPFSFWENPSKLPYPLHQVWSDPPLTPKVMEKIGVPNGSHGPTFHLSPHRKHMHHFL